MLIDISIAVTSTYSHGISSSYRKKHLYQLKGQNNTIQVESRCTYLRHDHDLVARQVKLFDSLSEDNFGTPIGIYLIITIQDKEIKSRDEKKRSRFNAHWPYQKYWFLHHNFSSESKPNRDEQNCWTYAALMCLIDSSSGKTHFIQSGEPYDIHPRMIWETFNPELPRRTSKCTDL